MADSNVKLFADFAPVSTEQWMERVTADLKGVDYDKKLVWKTDEGFKVKPFYRAEDLAGLATTNALPGEYPYLRGTKQDNNWLVRQEITAETLQEANAKALDVLNRGITSLSFYINSSDVNQSTLETLLNGIVPEAVELNFTTCQRFSVQLAAELVTYFTQKGCNLAQIKGAINFDIFDKILKAGKQKVDFAATAKQIIETLAPLPQFKAVGVNARSINNAGGYISQELGYALAWGNEYITALIAAGVDPSVAANSIKFTFGIGSNYFLEIAKFRAARMLWANIVTAQKGSNEAAKMVIHAETSTFNFTIYDAHVNMLRTQTESMSAALGGVDSMTVTPFDAPTKASDEFSERIARNQQLLLKEESNLDKVVDPAAGSYYIENLTVSIAEQAWNLFLAVEEAGGFYHAIKEGTTQAAINQTGKARLGNVSSRKEILLGTNQYPNFNEQLSNSTQAAGCGCGCTPQPDGYATLNFNRASSEFESLRMETEASGIRPKAFMLTIGNLNMRQARAQFACNFFGCAGYEVVDNLGFESVEAGVKAAMEAKADLVVLCSSDDEYAELAIPAYKALQHGSLFVVAGAPACADELKAAGIEHFINVRTNVLSTLKAFNAQLLKK